MPWSSVNLYFGIFFKYAASCVVSDTPDEDTRLECESINVGHVLGQFNQAFILIKAIVPSEI